MKYGKYMSRIGKKPINIPTSVEVDIHGNQVKAKGPLGETILTIPDSLSVSAQDGVMSVQLKNREQNSYAIWGLYRVLLDNLLNGVAKGFEKKLQIEGVGYRAELKGNIIVLYLGYSHPIELEIPEGLKVSLEKSNILISGIDKQKVGQFAADIRRYRKPEPYKGKGIRYEGEHIRRKAGKRAATGTSS